MVTPGGICLRSPRPTRLRAGPWKCIPAALDVIAAPANRRSYLVGVPLATDGIVR